jgi:hypothetical protein
MMQFQCSKQPSKSLYEQRRRLGKCYRCGEKYNPSHQYNKKDIHMIKENDENEEEFMEAEEGDNNIINAEEDDIK